MEEKLSHSTFWTSNASCMKSPIEFLYIILEMTLKKYSQLDLQFWGVRFPTTNYGTRLEFNEISLVMSVGLVLFLQKVLSLSANWKPGFRYWPKGTKLHDMCYYFKKLKAKYWYQFFFFFLFYRVDVSLYKLTWFFS